MSVEVYCQLFGLPCIGEEVVLLTPVYKVPSQSSVLRVTVVSDEANNRRVVRDILQNTAVLVVSDVCSVEGEEEGGQDGPRGGTHSTGQEVRHTFPVCEVVQDPLCQVKVQSS